MSQTLIKLKNHLVFYIFAMVLGSLIGVLVWGFFLLMNAGLNFLWSYLPHKIATPAYPIIVCTVGGLIIGICQKTFGHYPESLDAVMAKVSKSHWVAYDKIWVIFLCALLPLVFGGSVGPEAGLTGAIAGLCSYVGDRFKYAAKKTADLSKLGVAATLGVVFGAAPLLGILSPIDMDEKMTVPKKEKILLYSFCAFGAVISYALLNMATHSGMSLPYFNTTVVGSPKEAVCLIPLGLIGGLTGFFYYAFSKIVKTALIPLKRFDVIKGVLGGIVLGAFGVALPYTMFAGETQLEQLTLKFGEMGFWVLLATGVFKLFVSQVCLQTGFKGGNIFPVIFSGAAIGLASSFYIPADPMICMTTVTAATCGSVMKKPILAVLVLFLCFPPTSLVQLLVGAVIGSAFPIPQSLKETK